jgi:hypothetical protein
VPALGAATIFLSAFLLFLVQPLIGRFILPWFGGAPGVWTTCMLLFQALLLAGYAWAHGLVRALGPRGQAVAHCVLLGAAVAVLPITPDAAWKSATGDPTLRILALLAASLGLPYVALAATGPLLQAWIARSQGGRPPWRLYALSNAGSLLALLAYPFAIEPLATRGQQAVGWSLAFATFAVGCAACAWRAGRAPAALRAGARSAARAPDVAPPAARERVLWLLLPACASLLLLAVTSQLTADVAAVPLLWIAPLAVYLLSFIVCFEGERGYSRRLFGSALLVAFCIEPALVRSALRAAFWTQVAAWQIVLFAGCMVCHGELYRLRPSPRYLTGYYLAIACGGALGGLVAAVVAPRVFDRYYELPLALLGCGLLLAAALLGERAGRVRLRAAGAGLLLAGCATFGTLALRETARVYGDALSVTRNFYGMLAVREIAGQAPEARTRELRHGHVTHGLQFVAPERRRWATAYYGEQSGVGAALRLLPRPEGQRRIGVVGLGAGTLATYGRPGDRFRFYEINPAVVEIARRDFSFLADTPAEVEIALGDARLTLESEPDQHFDLLVLDAFSGDAIPLHLLTAEAFATWRRHVADDGVIAVHVSNTHVDLRPLVWAMADRLGWQAVLIRTRSDPARGVGPAHWMLLSANSELLERLAREVPPTPRPADLRRIPAWSDDEVNLFELLR